jgi:catechol 2,3-dioxygenase-like lactoylglutathione lyase family enzyme
MHHVAISVSPEHFEAIGGRLKARGLINLGPEQVSDSLYIRDPDGALIEITRDPLDEIGGQALGS